jgi:hypothetical protein
LTQLYAKDKNGNYIPYIPNNCEYYTEVISDQITFLESCIHYLIMLRQTRYNKGTDFCNDEVSYVNEISNKVNKLNKFILEYAEEYNIGE